MLAYLETPKLNPYRCGVCREPMFHILGQEYMRKRAKGEKPEQFALPATILVQLSCTCGYKARFDDCEELRTHIATHPEPVYVKREAVKAVPMATPIVESPIDTDGKSAQAA
jgi:hypothetical protein